MTQKMKEMLHEFGERDFSTFSMLDVLNLLYDIELDMRIFKIHSRREEYEFACDDKKNMKIHVFELQELLKAFLLDYDAKELLDSKVLKEMEDEL